VETGFSAYDGGPEFTFELFFKVFYVPGTGEKFELFRREDWGILEYDGTQQKFIFGLYGIGQVEYTVSLVTDEWHHIAAEYDESNLRIYLDGMVAATALGGGNLPETPADINIYVGENLEGLIDIVRMSDTGIYGGSSFDPYSNDYSAGAGVHLLWHCDEGSGNELYDASGTGHTGNIYGTPTWNTDEPIGGFMDPQLWYNNVGSDYVMLEWDRWPDSDAEFDKYELRWNTNGGVHEGDQSIFSETNPNTTNVTHDFLPQGDYYYKLWMYDQGGFSRYETNEVYVYVGGSYGQIDFAIESPQSVSGNIYVGVFYDGNPDSSPDVSLGPIWHDFATGNFYDNIDGIEEGDNYFVAFFFDGDGSPSSGPGDCDEGYDFDYSFYDVDVFGTVDLGTFMLQGCSGGGGEQVTVNYPNGGETFTEGDNMTITWDWTGGSIGFDIYLSLNSGGTFDNFIGNSNATDGSFSWTILDGAASPNCRIRIEDPGNDATFDESDSDFEIVAAGGGGPTDIHISSPSSGSNWSVGTGESIEWSSNTSDGMDYYVDIDLWKDGYIDDWIVGPILSQSSSGNYFWSIPNYIEDGNSYQVRVVHTESGVEDFSDYFQISGGGGGEISAVTLDEPVQITDTSLRLSWSVWSGSTNEFESYILKRNTTGNVQESDSTIWDAPTSIWDTSYVDIDLEPSNTYYYKVYVYNTFGDWSESNEVSATIWNPALDVDVTELNFVEDNDSLTFSVGNSGYGTLYWMVAVEYISGDGWITSVNPDQGSLASLSSETVSVLVEPTGQDQEATLHVHGYRDSGMTNEVGIEDINVHLDEWLLGTGEFTTEHAHLYWVAEEESSDTAVVLFSNVGDGELKIESVTSSEPIYIYPAEGESFPITVSPGEGEAVLMVIDPPTGPGTLNGTITFELGNATTEIETIDYSVAVYAAGEVDISNSFIDSTESGFYDLTDQVSMTVDFSSVVSGEGVLITYVDGAMPTNPDGDQDLAIADRYWEIASSLEDGDFTADLCFDLNDLEGIDDFSSLKILKRSIYSDDTWEEIPGSELTYDEANNLICAVNQTSFSQWTVGSDSTSGNFVVNPPAISGAPAISGDIPSSVMEGEDLTFVAQIVAEGGLDRVLLKYYVGGGTDKEITFIQVDGDNYQATIPGWDVTSSGLIALIAARDLLMQETFTDTAEILVEHSGISLGSTSAETYSMISIPGNVYDGDLGHHFEDELGPYDPSVWRLFKWNGTDYSEANFDLFPGEAYWIITRDPASLTSAEGASMEMLSSSPVNLISGWNMVANPYNFSLSFSDLQDNNADIEPVLYRYTGSGYTTTNSFVPGDGVWIYAHNPTTIIFDPLGSGSMSRTVAEELTWHGSMNATSSDLTDTENVFGAHVGASSCWDELDRHEPPVIGDYVTLAFDNSEWANHPGRYSRDIRSDTEAGHIWPFTVITNQSGYVSLSVELPDELPLGWELFLVDVAFDIVQNLSTEIEYEFVANGSETPREFELIAGPPGFTREALDDLELTPSDYRLAQNIPNPFNALTTIQFSLPKENEVSLAIYDLVGRKVAEPLSNVPYESGGHFVIWDGKDSQSRPVSSGVYLYRLEVSKNGQMEFAKTKKLILLK